MYSMVFKIYLPLSFKGVSFVFLIFFWGFGVIYRVNYVSFYSMYLHDRKAEGIRR